MLSPITGTSDTVVVEKLCSKHIAKRWENELNIELSESFKNLGKIERWRCNSSGFEWYSPPEALEEPFLYEKLQKFSWYYMAQKWEFNAAIEVFNINDKILEIGSGFGHFLAVAQIAGMEVEGIEINREAAKIIKDSGFSVYEDNLEYLNTKLKGNFDGVCAFQVLEHVNEPLPFLRGMLGMLRSNGKLVVSVPNAAVMKNIDPKSSNLLDMPPHHFSKWDEGVFKAIEEILPVNILCFKREPLQPYHISWFVNSFGTRLINAMGMFYGRLLVNRFSLELTQRILRLGVRKFIPGHTLLVVMEKRF